MSTWTTPSDDGATRVVEVVDAASSRPRRDLPVASSGLGTSGLGELSLALDPADGPPPVDPTSSSSRAPSSVGASSASTAPLSPASIDTYRVTSGDTLGLVAEVFRIPVSEIQRVNNLRPDDVIYPGDLLRVPSPRRAIAHTVAPGETLSAISRMHDFPVAHIRALNDLGPSATIHPGTVLRVLEGPDAVAGGSLPESSTPPSDVDTRENAPTAPPTAPPPKTNPSTTPPASRRPRPASSVVVASPERVARSVVAVVADAASALANLAFGGASRLVRLRLRCGDGASSSSGPAFVVVGEGESLASVARDAGMPIRELQRVNGITDDNLATGARLRVTPLRAHERQPRLRRRTKRHLFQRSDGTGEGDARLGSTRRRDVDGKIEDVSARWRHRAWRHEPRGAEARAFFARRSGVGRGGPMAEDCPVEGVNAAIRAAGYRGARPTAWESRRPRRERWHPTFGNPVPGTSGVDSFVTSGFGPRWGRLHAGVDVAANEGTPIRAAARGTVSERSYDEAGYGWSLKVDHGDGWETRYAHCLEIKARVGQTVRAGEKVAKVGNTGRSFGPHLHFEVRRNGVAIDPLICTDA